jgi:hypothetical protein
MDNNVEGYELASGMEMSGGCGDLGVKVFVRVNRKMNETDRNNLRRIMDDIESAVMKETLRLDPETAKAAAVERAELLDCFSVGVYVEEIPNGYCNRYCCAFKPWYVVTTPKGRIKIGWRKSVIRIEWTDSAIKASASEIFPKEEAWPGYETTQYEKIIHAHGIEKAKEYINRILERN